MMCDVPMFLVLDQVFSHLDDEQPSRGCRASASACNRGFCGGKYPYKKPQSPRSRQASHPRPQQVEARELDDSYVLFVDVPGYAREDVHVNVEDGQLFVTASPKHSPPADEASSSRELLSERPRGGMRHAWKLPQDAMLDGIHAKLNNGELVIAIPKKVPKSFQVPVLGADEEMTHTAQPMLASAPAAADAPAEPMAESAHGADAAPAVTVAAAPEPEQATMHTAAPESLAQAEAATVAPNQDAAMDGAEETDGSWVDVSDEEREAEAAQRRAKGKMLMEGPVLEEIERQEAAQRAAAAGSDSD